MVRVARLSVIFGVAALFLAPAAADAHCDGLDGPVVKAAQAALATGDPAPVLVWIRAGDEPEVRRVFAQTREVRKTGDAARELADRYFFETVVRLHRAGEGEPYTGLKPAGRDLGPAIPAADAALESGSADELTSLLTQQLEQGIASRFAAAVAAKRHAAAGDLAAGREAVEAYVAFLQYVERVHAAADATPGLQSSDPHR